MAKRLTEREKKERAKIKKELIAEGLIPPDKKPLNRKKFIEEVRTEFDQSCDDCYMWDVYVHRAVGVMMTHTDKHFRLSEQAVGAAKVLKIAMRLREFDKKILAEGRTEFKISEQYDYIKDIIDL